MQYTPYPWPENTKRPFAPEETLYFYDGPLLFWMPHPVSEYLAIALPEEPGNDSYPLLLCKISPENKVRLESKQLTLRQATVTADEWLYMPDYYDDNLQVSKVEELPDEWLPGDAYLNMV